MQINKELRINVIQLNVCDSHTVVLMALGCDDDSGFFYFIFGWQSLCAMRAMRVHSDNDEENTLGRIIHAMIGSWWVPAVGHSEHELMALHWKMADDGRWVGGFVESVVRLIGATFDLFRAECSPSINCNRWIFAISLSISTCSWLPFGSMARHASAGD